MEGRKCFPDFELALCLSQSGYCLSIYTYYIIGMLPPCFDENWYLVALHHAQKAKTFGSIREGILFANIYQDIIKKQDNFQLI
jgi:hypothetical protein